jgi:hypothetical protein
MASGAALVIELVPGARVQREAELVPHLPIVDNGPPATTVIFADGTRVPLPTHRVVSVDDAAEGRGARVGLGGMSFAGLVAGLLLFVREPAAAPSSEPGTRMTLAPSMVACVTLAGRVVWPTLH